LQSIDKIADDLANSLIFIIPFGFDIGKLDVVTTATGADFAGRLGRKIKEKTFGLFKLPRIVALEPRKISDEPLNTTDANFVMSIYTENFFRNVKNVGHVEFFVNGGVKQPKCDKKLFRQICDYNTAQEYWLEVVEKNSATTFPARQCNSYSDYKNGACNSNTLGYMNMKTADTLRGKFFLNTNKESPYSRDTANP
jgi:hypothetical protein